MSRLKHDVQFFLYLKGPDLTDAEQATLPAKVEIIRLLNVGRCDHTFLHHIVSHVDSLTDVTVFVSGDGGDTRKGPIIQHVIAKAIATMDPVLCGQHMHNVRDDLATFELKDWTSTSAVNQQGRAHRPSCCPLRFGRSMLGMMPSSQNCGTPPFKWSVGHPTLLSTAVTSNNIPLNGTNV